MINKPHCKKDQSQKFIQLEQKIASWLFNERIEQTKFHQKFLRSEIILPQTTLVKNVLIFFCKKLQPYSLKFELLLWPVVLAVMKLPQTSCLQN